MKQRVTIGDVAKAAGVSKQTVSRAINDKGEISADTKERIMQVVRELGYRPNRLAQAMNTQKSFMVGLIVPDITNPFFPEVARGVQDGAYSSDYNVFFCNSDDDAKVEINLLESLAAQGVDGIILFSHQATDTQLKAFADTFRPIVLVNRTIAHPNIDTLIVNNMLGGEMAADHLIAAGHTEIGMFNNRDFSVDEIRRVSGFRDVLIDSGLSAENIINAEPTLVGGYQATEKLFEQNPTVSAIFTYNDMMGIGAIRACHDLGRRVPEDVAIIGFDDIHLASMYSPSLSSVRVDKYELGKLALRRLLHLIENPGNPLPPDNVKLELMLRESTRVHELAAATAID